MCHLPWRLSCCPGRGPGPQPKGRSRPGSAGRRRPSCTCLLASPLHALPAAWTPPARASRGVAAEMLLHRRHPAPLGQGPQRPPPLPYWFPSSRLTTGCARPPHKGGSPANRQARHQARAGWPPGELRHRRAAWGFPSPCTCGALGSALNLPADPSQTHRDPHRPMSRPDGRTRRDPGPEGPQPDGAPQSPGRSSHDAVFELLLDQRRTG